MASYREFLEKLQKWGSHSHRISHCLGARDAFHWVRKNHWEATGGIPVDKLLYSRIISEVHKVLVEALMEGHEIEFPYQMGSLVLNRVKSRVYYRDGKLQSNYRNDWKKTLEYRFNEDPDGDVFIRDIQPYIYTIRYYKNKARYHNRKFYHFRANRSLIKLLWTSVKSGKVNAETIDGYSYKDAFLTRKEKSYLRDI